MEAQIEEDGIADNFYRLIWEKQDNDQGIRGFLLPNTVIYKHQQPRAWYFSSKKGNIKRKHKEKLNVHHIELEFLNSVSKSGIIAYFIFIGDNGREIEYFQVQEFRNFLHNRHKTFDGVLQQFIDPKGRKNSIIQMIWTSHLCLFEMRENLNDLYDVHLDQYSRAITFEGDTHLSQVKPFNGLEIRNLMQEIGETLVEHFSIISNGKVKITRIVLIFKTDCYNQLWLLMASSIRCASLKPLNISCVMKFPTSINCKRSSSNLRNPLCIQKKVLCKSCECSCEVDRMYEIAYKNIIAKNQKSIPHIIKRYHPKITESDYDNYKNDVIFLNRIALVCDNCYLSYVKEPQIKKAVNKVVSSKTPTPMMTDRKIKTPIRLKMNNTVRLFPK